MLSVLMRMVGRVAYDDIIYTYAYLAHYLVHLPLVLLELGDEKDVVLLFENGVIKHYCVRECFQLWTPI